jgi:hypothetical protein
MAEPEDPITLELAPLPREQIGPFLILGVDKDADADTVEAHWAQRLIWARKNQLPITLPDINWAREVLNDFEQRVRADVLSLNADTATHTLRDLAEKYGATEPGGPTWQPLEAGPAAVDPGPEIDLPDLEAVRQAIDVPELPWEAPAMSAFLDSLLREPLDPWNLPEDHAG